MIFIHESGAQEDQFDGKKNGGKKSRDTIPLNGSFFSRAHNHHLSNFYIYSELLETS
jgi:hypothetical protein